ncbi:hypothetical protein F5H01DRAFT_316302 [Linnemannia elongata]|nr:hypothetical protein F5H01DRAFT_316302 [Linnemannia elongata]
MRKGDVQDLRVDRLIIRDSLDSSDTSAPRSTVHIIDPHLNPLTHHQDATPDTNIDSEPASQQENVMEIPLELSQEQRNNTDNSITNVTSTTQQNKTSNIKDTAADNEGICA